MLPFFDIKQQFPSFYIIFSQKMLKKFHIFIFWIFRFFHEIAFLLQKSWDISRCDWQIFNQRPDLERLLNSTIKFRTVTYSFKESYLSKMLPKWAEDENLSFCHTNLSTKNANFKKPTQRSMFLDRIWSLFSVFLQN
jgi:hypothetical protein